MAYGRGGNDGVLLPRSGKHIRTAHWSASPHHSPLSHSHQHQPINQSTCLSMTLPPVWTTSSACFMGNRPPSPLLTTRLRPALPLLVLRVIRPPNLLVLPASLVRQLPPSSPSTSMDTSSAGGIVIFPTLFLLRLVDGPRARPSAMIGSRTSI